jgi:hypothetical protein
LGGFGITARGTNGAEDEHHLSTKDIFMTDYSQMSDQLINIAVAEAIDPGRQVIESKSRPPAACIIGSPGQWVDYCNNPADAWPIITQNLISIDPDYEFIDISEEQVFPSGLWISEYTNGRGLFLRHADESPLRAAMIIFLKMKDAESANPI